MDRDKTAGRRSREAKYDTGTEISSESDSEDDEKSRGAMGGKRRLALRKDVETTDKVTGIRYDQKGRKSDARGATSSASEGIMYRQAMKARHYDGNTPWESFLIQFEICADYNSWTNAQKMAQLKCCLSGKAAQVLWDTDMNEIFTYEQLVEKLKSRFSSTSQRERFVEELRSRRRRAGENLSDLHADIRRLFALAYGSKVMDTDVSEAIARDYFIASLNNPDLEIRVKEKDPAGLDDALKAAIRAETHLKAYEQAAERAYKDRHNKQDRESARMRHVKEESNTSTGERES